MPTLSPRAWLDADRQRAREARDPNAALCWLASLDELGRPRVRTLVLRDLGEQLALFVNATSAKWPQLQRDQSHELALWLPSQQCQWRLLAQLRPLPASVIAEHWPHRPRSSQVLDHLYEHRWGQSAPLPSSQAFAEQHAALDAQLSSTLTPPPSVRALALELTELERLQLTPAPALHERLHFRLRDGAWEQSPLTP